MALFSFWADSYVPPTPDVGPWAWQLGMAFQSSAAGTITALQFYKLAADTGTHVGYLWRESDHALLGSITFTGETASGWQTATFPTPIAIAAGTRYRVGVEHPTGNVAWLQSAPNVDNGPLTMDAAGYYYPSLGANYPDSASSDYRFGYVDVIADVTVTATSMRVSQAVAEAWAAPASEFRASQAVAEVWATYSPVTLLVVSQAVAEVWIPSAPPAPPPTFRRAGVSAQVV